MLDVVLVPAEKAWQRFGRLFCRATHLDNWWCARILAVGFWALIVLPQPTQWILTVIFTIDALFLVRNVEKLRRENRDQAEVRVLSRLQQSARSNGRFWTCGSFLWILFVLLSPSQCFFTLGLFLGGGAYFVALFPIAKQPSRTKATLRNLRAALQKIPSVAPSPVPS